MFLTLVARGQRSKPTLFTLLFQKTGTSEAVRKALQRLENRGIITRVAQGIYVRPKISQVGKRTIKFKKTTPKNLMAKGKISRLVIQALREIGAGKVLETEEKKIIELLKKEEANYLIHDIQLAPEWIRKIMKQAL